MLDPPNKGNILTARGLNIVLINSRDYVTYVDGFIVKAGQRTGVEISKTVYEDMPARFNKFLSNGDFNPNFTYQRQISEH